MDIGKEDNLEIIRNFLPKYLTPEQTDNLFNNVKEHFPFSKDSGLLYSLQLDTNTYYQGDCIKDIPFSVFDKGNFKVAYLPGVIMSNTCDISSDNERLELPSIQFAAVFSLSEYVQLLREKKIAETRINSFLEALKENRISNLLYLPTWQNGVSTILEDSFVRFDQNVTLPSALFNDSTSPYNPNYTSQGDRLFSFKNYGFYLFLIKLSVHYCRFREGVFRSE